MMDSATKMPLVSIGMPCYNLARGIGQTIESVLKQGYPHIEHWAIDGRSSVGTVGILERFSHLDWTSEQDEGQSNTLNKAFHRMQCSIFSLLNIEAYLGSGAAEILRNTGERLDR